MRPGATRVESKGSVWFFDADASEYLRMPKQEGPRLSPEGEDWGGPGAGALQDLIWLPFAEQFEMGGRLYIVLPGEEHKVITAPLEGEDAAEERADATLHRMFERLDRAGAVGEGSETDGG